MKATSASAATYYVDPDNGNNTTAIPNDQNHPYKYVCDGYCLISPKPGDSILFKRGNTIPNGQIYITWSGTADNPITIGDYGNPSDPKPSFSYTTILNNSDWSDDGGGIYHKEVGALGWGNFLLEDKKSIQKATDTTLSSPSGLIPDVTPRWFYDSNTHIMYYQPSSGTPPDHELRVPTRNQIQFYFVKGPVRYINFNNLDIWGNVYPIYDFYVTTEHINFSGCDFHDNGNAVWFYGKGHAIQISQVQNNATYTVTINGTDCSYTSDADATAQEVSDGLKAAIEVSDQRGNVAAGRESSNNNLYLVPNSDYPTTTVSSNLTDLANQETRYNNIIFDNCSFNYNFNNIYFAGQDDGIHGPAPMKNMIIRNCDFTNQHRTRDGGAWAEGGDNDGISAQNLQNSIIENNEISGIASHDAAICFWSDWPFSSSNIIVRNNYIHDITHGSGIIIIGAQSRGTPSYQIYNNVIVNCAGSENWRAGLYLGRMQDPIKKSQIHNNTIWNCVNGILGNGGGAAGQNEMDNYVIKNNIIGGNSVSNIRLSSTIRNNIFDNNLYYSAVGSIFYYNNKAVDYATWKNDISGDAHSSTLDPLLTNPSGKLSQLSDFKLSAGSPAIDAGADVGLASDFEGTPIPQGSAPDIGAFEYKAVTYSNADLNQDNSINSADLDILKTDFLKLTESLINSRSDINADGQCTARDLGILMSEWK
jgi:hypothetical protein